VAFGEDRQIAIEEEGALELVRLHEPLELRRDGSVFCKSPLRFAAPPQPLVEPLVEGRGRTGRRKAVRRASQPTRE